MSSERREQVVLGPLPPSFLRLETRTSNGETVTTVTADPAINRDNGQVAGSNGQVALPRPPALPPTATHPAATHPAATHPAATQAPVTQVPRPRPPTYATQAGFSITIAQALLNKSYTLIGSMDPYLRLQVGHNIYETFTAAGADKNPRWNKIYHCPIPNQSSVRSFSVEVFDEKALTQDQRVAWANINLPQSVFEGHTLDEWFPLTGKLGDGKEGTINLIITYTTMPMVTAPYQRIHYPYAGHLPHHVTPRPPTPISEADVDQLKDMFPDVDRQVVKTILECQHGNVENAVTAILQMSADQPAAQQQQPAAQQPPPPVQQPAQQHNLLD